MAMEETRASVALSAKDTARYIGALGSAIDELGPYSPVSDQLEELRARLAGVGESVVHRNSQHLEAERLAAAEEAFLGYNFGEEWVVKGDGGWEFTTSSNEARRNVYLEYDGDDEGMRSDDSTLVHFVVSFRPGTALVVECWVSEWL